MDGIYDGAYLLLRILLTAGVLYLMYEFFSKPLLDKLSDIIVALRRVFEQLVLLVEGINAMKALLDAISGKLDLTNQQLKERANKSDNTNIN